MEKYQLERTDDYWKSYKDAHVLHGDNEDVVFSKLERINNRLRYCNGSFYRFKDPEVQKEYTQWSANLSHDRSFELYYGGGIVD